MPEKVTKFLTSMHDICPKMPEFYIRPMFNRKIFSGIFCGGGQGNAPLPSPTPMAGPQAPHQLNPALLYRPMTNDDETNKLFNFSLIELNRNAVAGPIACCVRVSAVAPPSESSGRRRQLNNATRPTHTFKNYPENFVFTFFSARNS